MTPQAVLRDGAEVSTAWLSRVLGKPVVSCQVTPGHGNWSRQFALSAQLGDGRTVALRLKVCLGSTFGRSEVDYYRRDYADMADPPLVRCWDAQYDPAVGYHLLLDDLSATHTDRRDLTPTLAHGLALADALGRLHRHHWCSRPAPAEAVINRYLDEIRPGVSPLAEAIGQPLQAAYDRHEQAFRQRWARPAGMSLLHGDLNPSNVLTPLGADAPLYCLDRQPFDWSLTYGVAAYDLAYAIIPWWPAAIRQALEGPVLRCWYQALDQPGYAWDEAVTDWRLSVEQCLHVPMEWCSKADTLGPMRWLWQAQFSRIQNAVNQPGLL